MQNINLITNILNRNLNKFFWSSVTNFSGVRCGFQGGLWCSVRKYHDVEYDYEYEYEDNYQLKREREREDLKNKYKIIWTKEYKNLNKMLSIKGLVSNKLIDENNIKYLVFSLTDNNYNLYINKAKAKKGVIKIENLERDIFYSVSLIIQSSWIKDEKKTWLYKIILNKLQENSSLIKEGGRLDIYYVASSELEDNIKESFSYEDRVEYGAGNYSTRVKKKLIPSISEIIDLNKNIKNKLEVNIYVFTCESFFRNYLTSNNLFSPYIDLDRKNSKLWAFPILIIEDMTLSTVTYLFKERNINFHGMSNTRRHKLSPLQKI